ncbi:MAG: hypothetical protein K2X44_11985 [Magnetospirillum sp.]|nr:hypothetical protein [Magnetospirillum sp.]
MSAATLRRVRQMVSSCPIRLISVDVFDTVMMRTTKPEFVRFAEAAKLQAQALQQAG